MSNPEAFGPFTMTIDGGPAEADARFDVVDPSTGLVVAQPPDASRADLDAAVCAAQSALPGWSALGLTDRRKALVAIADCLLEHRTSLAALLTAEQGKPIRAARHEIAGAAEWLKQVSEMDLPCEIQEGFAGEMVRVRRVPVGVVGAIVPWNFPITLAVWKIAPALLTGNTVVLKPSPFTPLTTLHLGELLRPVLPRGVLNVISGGDRLGPWMSSHPGIAKIAFTGSTATGRRVMESAARDLKRITLELGGNDAAIVMPDVDVSKVAKSLFWGAFANSGQICVAAKRIYVHESVYQPLADELAQLASRVKLGPGSQAEVDMGPVQNRAQYERVLSLFEDCRTQGYRFLCGGYVPKGTGYFLPPTIVDNPPDDARVVTEEPFGPIVPLLKFRDVHDVISRANATEYGLAASVWCSDDELALFIAEHLQAGTVWINQIHTMSPLKPMAGHKQSGFGVENALEGLLAYTVPQTISLRIA